MIQKYLKIAFVTLICAKWIFCLPSASYYSKIDEKSQDTEEETSTMIAENSFPQSRLEIEDDGLDALMVQPSSNNLEKQTETWSTKYEVESSDDELNRKGNKKGPKRKKKKNSSLQKFLPLLLIPFIIQTKIIPIFLFNLKIIALKALMVGKLAMLLVAFNMIRNMLIANNAHVNHIDSKYSMDHLAQDHYGYSGGTEYGAWVNRRQDDSMLASEQTP